MPIIRPSGLLTGERIAALSDIAKLYWPFLYAASNGYGRFELDYFKIVDSGFRHFQQKPTQETIRELIREYRDKHLLFIYKANGRLWCAWDDAAHQQYFNSRDKASPAPPEPAFSEWRYQYKAKKQSREEELTELEKEFDPAPENCSIGFNIESISNQYEVDNESITNLHNTNTDTQLNTQTHSTQEHIDSEHNSTRARETVGPQSVPPYQPTDEETLEFSDWCEARYGKHPKKRDKFESLRALKRFCRDPAARALFERNHDLYCETHEWTKQGGSFAPRLWEFIEDDGWKYPPIQPSKQPQNTRGRGLMADLLG
jgi:hypothetical protein